MSDARATISTLAEYWDKIYEITEEYKNTKQQLFYRGHTNYDYKCEPGIMRKSSTGLDEREQYNKIVQEFPEEFRKNAHLSNLVKMQHYGIKTRLLDFTVNPLIALYFAVEFDVDNDGSVVIVPEKNDNILTHTSDKALMLSCLPPLREETKKELKEFFKDHRGVINDGHARNNECVRKFLHEIRGEYPAFETEIVGQHMLDYYFVFANRDNERMKRQYGLFAIMGLDHEKNINDIEEKAIHIRINAGAKKRILKELDMMQINQEYVYPGLERKAMLNNGKRVEWKNI